MVGRQAGLIKSGVSKCFPAPTPYYPNDKKLRTTCQIAKPTSSAIYSAVRWSVEREGRRVVGMLTLKLLFRRYNRQVGKASIDHL